MPSDTFPRLRQSEKSFRLAWIFWIACSLIYFVMYLRLADIAGHRLLGLLLSSTIIFQSILVTVYALRASFTTHLEALIRTVALGVALSGLLPALVVLARLWGHSAGFQFDPVRLQTGFLWAILFLTGIANGAVLAFLRYNSRDSLVPGSVSSAPRPAWLRWFNSAVLWIASIMTCAAIVAAFSKTDISDTRYITVSISILGVFLIAPLSVTSRANSEVSRGRQIWTYFRRSLAVLLLLAGVYTLFALTKGAVGLVYAIYFAIYFVPALSIPCLLWSILSALTEVPFTQPVTSRGPQIAPPAFRPRVLTGWRFALLILASQPLILVSALLATAPPSLGFSGIGCVSAYSTRPAEYWFWQAYKGVRSISQSWDRVVFRPAVDANVCVIVDDRWFIARWSDPWEVSLGYAEAARSWFWLIDPDSWDSPRTQEIRRELTRLLGKDFSSYVELQEWWNQNSPYLTWSGQGEYLEVHQPTTSELANSYKYRQDHPTAPPSTIENFRIRPNAAAPELSSGKVDKRIGSFHAAMFDREARLRGLQLAAVDSIAVLDGSGERTAREYLERVFGRQFATRAEWEKFFAAGPSPPWTMSQDSAKYWIGWMGLDGQREPYRSHGVEELRKATGLNYSEPEQFIPWLENPSNTRQQEWLKGHDLVSDLPGVNPMLPSNHAMAQLKMITDQSFNTPESWTLWWESNRRNLVLSAEGTKLVVRH